MRQTFIGIFFISFLVLAGCEKEDLPSDLTGTIWKLEGFVKTDGSWEPNNEFEEIRFEIIDSTGVRIQLPINECGADVLVLTDKKIQLGAPVCTEVCCDPQYALDFMGILSQVVSYYVEGKKLYLQGPQGSAIFFK